MYYNSVIDSNTNLSEEIFENSVWPQESVPTNYSFVRGPEVFSVESAGTTYYFQTAVPVISASFENSVWPQESYLTSEPTNYAFVRGPEVFSVESVGTTYYFQTAVPVISASYENSARPQDSDLPPAPTNCYFVRGPEVYSVESAGTTYFYQRAVPVPIVSDLEIPLQSDIDRVSDPVLSENTDLLNDEINDYGIVNSSASSLSSSADSDTGNSDNDLESSDSSYILHITETFGADGTDVQQNGNVLDWSVIDETLGDFYEDNNVCIENCNDGLSENKVEIESSTSDSLSEYDTKALNKYLKDRLYLLALSGHLYQKESIPVVDILPVVEEECFSSEDDYESESRKVYEKSVDEKSSVRNISNHISEELQPNSSEENCLPFSRDYGLKSMESENEKSAEQKSIVKQVSNYTLDLSSPIPSKEECSTMFPSDLESNKENAKFIQQTNSACEKGVKLCKENEKSVEQNSSVKQDYYHTFKRFDLCLNTEECSLSSKDYCKLIADDFPETVTEPPKFGEDTPLHIGEYTNETEKFDKATPLHEESLCFEGNLKLRSGDKDLVKTEKILSNTDERNECRNSKFSVFEENYPEEDLPTSRVDLPFEDSSIPTVSTETKKPKKKKRFMKLRKWVADRLLCCVRKNNSLEQ